MDNIEPSGTINLLNLPEPIMDSILKRLSPMELVGMSEVCTCLRDRCRSDPLWEVHVKQKWGKVIGDVAYKEWQWHITTAKDKGINQFNQHNNHNGSLGSFSGTWPMLYLRSYLEDCGHLNSSLANSFMMTLYFSLLNGKFWFPAQIYRGALVRHALVRYDSKSDDFEVRLQNGGWHIMGYIQFQWDNLRAPPVDTPPCDRYVSDCLQDLKPGDHIEIQWKSRREITYVGDFNDFNYNGLQIGGMLLLVTWTHVMKMRTSAAVVTLFIILEMDKLRVIKFALLTETLIVEFKQYAHGSRMKRVKLLRNGEQCEEATGCYGGIRKLHSEEEIQRWERQKLLPPHQTPQNPLLQLNGERLLGSFSGFWPLVSLGSYLENPGDLTNLLLSNCSMMAFYISLQSGRFWFPAQVYKDLKPGDHIEIQR
ncbi:F-box protein, partial [Mucuna pruriens]